MKTLSIKQPYATLVCAGIKDVENRSWTTEYRGPLLIHATQWTIDLFDKKLPLPLFHEYDDCVGMNGELKKESEIIGIDDSILVLNDERFKKEFVLLKKEIALQADRQSTMFPVSSIVGKVELIDIVRNHDSPWSVENNYNWIFDKAELFESPIVGVKGKLRLWTFNR